MRTRWVKLIGKLFWAVIFFLFIYNPVSPLSIPVFWHESFYWAPIFQADYVTFYQIVLGIFLLADLFVSLFDFLFPDMGKFGEIGHDLVALAQLVVIRDVPKAAVNLSAATLDNVYPVVFWVLNIILFFTLIEIIVKILRLTMTHPKMSKHI